VSRSRSRKASPRVLIGTGVAVVAVIAVVVVALTLTRGGGSSTSAGNVPARGSLVNAVPGAAAVHALLKGVPQHGNVLGSPEAPVTLVEYVDLQCPYCREFELNVMPKLVSNDVRAGKLRIELRPVAFIGADSVRGRNAAIAAGDQNHMFDFAQLAYLNQGAENTGWLDDSAIKAFAASIPGLDVPRLLADRDNSATGRRADAFDSQQAADGVNSTPTILVGRTGGRLAVVRLSSLTDAAPVTAAIAAAQDEK
jgi:protein-disulfide isomerase